MKRFWNWLPDHVDRRVRVLAWLSLICQVVLVGTGGLVRLTASGLGCPTWPTCTDDSLVNTPEMGVHGIIEFGNRTLTFVLVVIAIAMFLAVIRFRAERRDLFLLALFIGLGIPAQGVIGGLSVLTHLNPYVVGLHFVISVVLVCLATVLVVRVYATPGPRERAVPRWFAVLAVVLSVLVAITIVFGILTTGSGPHAGDANAPRNDLNPELLQHVHSWPAYAVLAVTLVMLVATFTARIPGRRAVLLLLAVEVLQIIVGLWQARTGLPPFLVGIHMVLAVTLAAATTNVVMGLTRRVSPSAEDVERPHAVTTA
ncbi:heme A synthase [Glaciibacter flavus]|uniref:Heme A synthase n=1 Tax=Orlajensenia flava TaxID=2565934 RepID=A0A4S4FXE3_9MICO|nr:COX15/CtaA family protein [Glaciibacter flavus]THG35244.1 heme A synthase [Glaciibacter flavus]